MNTINKILYSLFTFFVCGTSVRQAMAAANTQYCGSVLYGTSIYVPVHRGNSWMNCCRGAYDSSATGGTTSACGAAGQVSLSSYKSVCIKYNSSTIHDLSLYECSVVSNTAGCGTAERWDGSKCVTCDTGLCSGTLTGPTVSYIRPSTCTSCAMGFYYDQNMKACTACPTSGGIKGQTSGCFATSKALLSSCYIKGPGNGSDTTGSFSIGSETCYYK